MSYHYISKFITKLKIHQDSNVFHYVSHLDVRALVIPKKKQLRENTGAKSFPLVWKYVLLKSNTPGEQSEVLL